MNKKIIAIAAAVLVLSGCSSAAPDAEKITVSEVHSSLTETELPVSVNVTEKITENIPEETAENITETTSETTEETTAADNEQLAHYNELAERFLNALSEGRGKEELSWATYDFLEDLRISDYTIQLESLGDWYADYAVTIDVSESPDEIFPLGKSDWYLTVSEGGVAGCIQSFRPADRYPEGYDRDPFNTFEDGSAMDKAVGIAYNVSFIAGIFDTSETPLEVWQPADSSVHRFYHAVGLDYENGVTPQQLSEEIKKCYGLNIPADSIGMKLDEDGFLPKSCGHGGSWTLFDMMDYSSDEKEIVIELQFYGDEGSFYPVKRSKYYFDINEDNSVSLRSVERVFDKGCNIVALTV